MKHTISLKKNHIFRRLYSKGKSSVLPYFVIYVSKNNLDYSRFGITTGLKLGNAVKRNRARRRIREIYRINEGNIKSGYDIVIVARTKVLFSKFSYMEKGFLKALTTLKLIKEETL